MNELGVYRQPQEKLRKGLRPVAMWAVVAGMLIGPWLVVAGWTFSLTGPSIVLSYTVCALLMIPIGLVYAELVTMLPAAGGTFHYTSGAFGPTVGFFFAWMVTLAYNGLIAANIMGPIFILQEVGWLPGGEALRVSLSVALAVAFAVVHGFKVDVAGRIQVVMVLLLLAGGLIVNGALLFFSPSWNVRNLRPFFTRGLPGFLLSVGLLSNMYFGFEAIPQLAEEAGYPVRGNARILPLSIGTAWVVYVVAMLGIAGSAPSAWIVDNQLAPARVLILTWGRSPIGTVGFALAIAVGALGAVTGFNGFWLALTRLYYALGRSGAFPRILSRLNACGVPKYANALCLLIVVGIISASGTDFIAMLFVLMTTGVVAAYVGDSLAFVVLRLQKPHWRRPFKLPGGITLGVISCAVSLYCLYWALAATTARGWVLLLIYLGAGLLVYLWMSVERRRRNSAITLMTPDDFEGS